MRDYLFLAQSDVTARALGAWLELMGEPRLVVDAGAVSDPRFILDRGHSDDLGISRFEFIASRLEAAVVEAGCRSKVVVLVDSVKIGQLNPIDESGSWESNLAMLILAFPEVRWFFGVMEGRSSNGWEKAHNFAALCSGIPRDPQLDGSGLRDWVRACANGTLVRAAAESQTQAATVPHRTNRAATIDEEHEYALFHAYAAYRFGYRSDAVTSWSLMEKLFGGAETPGHGYSLLLEDVNLLFPDRPADKRLADFRDQRSGNCKKLGGSDDSDFRIIVTSGHPAGKGGQMRRNRDFLLESKGPHKTAVVLKPAGGIFDLWELSLLARRLSGKGTRGLAPGYVWPPRGTGHRTASGHSAPGKLMLVARHLVRRADAWRANANTVEECIRGAVLATDALELLGYLTPTLAEHALALRHEFEVRAEVAFIGVGYHFEIIKRLDELEREADCAASFYHRSRRRSARLDLLVSIGTRLAVVFREAGQFEEEHACVNRVRHWHNSLWMARQPWRYVYWPVLRYFELLLSSLQIFCYTLAGWLLALTATFALLRTSLKLKTTQDDHLQSLGQALSSFFGTEVFVSDHPAWIALSVLATLAGFTHLGIFISHLYTIVSRK